MTKAEMEITATTKIKVLVDVTIECEVPRYARGYSRDLKEQEKSLKRWVSDFTDFIRDHRSQDPVNLSVVPVYEEQCSACHRQWDPVYEDGKLWCGGCGAEVKP